MLDRTRGACWKREEQAEVGRSGRAGGAVIGKGRVRLRVRVKVRIRVRVRVRVSVRLGSSPVP